MPPTLVTVPNCNFQRHCSKSVTFYNPSALQVPSKNTKNYEVQSVVAGSISNPDIHTMCADSPLSFFHFQVSTNVQNFHHYVASC